MRELRRGSLSRYAHGKLVFINNGLIPEDLTERSWGMLFAVTDIIHQENKNQL